MTAIDVSIVLPCFNEEHAIPELLPRLFDAQWTLQRRGLSSEIIVVDDASTDRSVPLLRAFDGLTLARHETQKGYGAALKKGFEMSHGEWVLFLDMDRTYLPEDIPDLVRHAQETESDMVSGQRPFRESGMPWTRGLGNQMYVWLARWLLGSPLRDLCTGFRVFRRAHVPSILRFPQDGLHFSLQLSLFALLQGWKIEEVTVGYQERKGLSKLNLMTDGAQFFWTILRCAWSRP